jgi:tetratricopeptide (TPR) repeat protein
VQFLRRLGAAKQIPALAQAPDAELLPLVRAVAYNPKLIELLVGLRDYARIQRVAAALPANLARARDQLLAEALTRVQETPGALALLQQMPVFSQAADYAAVQAVGGPGLPAGSTFDDALDASLTTALLVTDSAPDGRVRYRLPPLVQGYLTVAPALAPPPQLLAAVSRHMSYFAEFALAHQQPDAYPALVQAWPNLRAGWAAADLLRQRAVAANNPTTAGQAAQYLLAYGLALHDFVLLRGLWTEGRPLLTASATAARETGEDRYEFPILLDLAKIVEEQGDPAAARGMYERCLAIARAHDDPAAGAVALHRLGIVAAEAGQVETARRYYDESLAAARQAGNTESESATLHQLAILDAAAGDVAQAHRRYAESLALAQHIGDVQGEARTLHQLATLNAQAGDVPAARAGYEQSLQLKRTIGDVQGEAASEVMLGKLLFDQGDHAAGLALLRAGVATYQGLGSLRELQQADALLQARLAAMSSPTHPQGDAGGGAAPTPPDPAGQVSA